MKVLQVSRRFTRTAALVLTLLMGVASTAEVSAQLFRRGGRSRQYQQNNRQNNTARPASTQTSRYWTSGFEFGAKEHNFGAVATASKQEHVFEFRNTLETPIYLTGVRASCGCTKPTILTPKVNPGEMARVHAKYDTVSFRGAKSATVTVSLRRDQPYRQSGEVQFAVKGQIRQDVVTSPGLITFSDVSPGQDHARTVKVKYAGNPNWKVVDVRSSNPNLKIDKKEVSRSANGRVAYELTVRLVGEQQVGMFNDELTLVTNDRNGEEMKLAVEGRVKAIIESSAVNLGIVEQGAKIEKKLVLRGSEAFEIYETLVDDPRIMVESPSGKKSMHVLTYRLNTDSAGEIDTSIKVKTSAAGQPETVVPFRAKIVVPSAIVDR